MQFQMSHNNPKVFGVTITVPEVPEEEDPVEGDPEEGEGEG